MSLTRAINQTTRAAEHCVTSMLSLLLNRGCALCDRPSSQPFCTDCHRQLQDSYHAATWTRTQNEPWPISALGSYEGTLKQAIKVLKYNHRPEIATVLGNAFGQYWRTLSTRLAVQGPSPSKNLPYVVPIPLHTNRYQQRGYNQAERIANAFCQTSGLPLLADGLKRVEDTLPQHQLGLERRQENLAGAFAIGSRLARLQRQATTSPSILLIDDIYTTGATMRSATDALGGAGLTVVGILTVARAMSD